MKIKMTTCAVTVDGHIYHHGVEYDTEATIDENLAKSYVDVKFATITEITKKETKPKDNETEEEHVEEVKEEEVVVEEKVRRRRVKKDEV